MRLKGNAAVWNPAALARCVVGVALCGEKVTRTSCYFDSCALVTPTAPALLLQPRRRHVLDFGVALAHMRCG